MPTRFANEEGWLLVTSMMLMGIMMVVALGSFSLVDTQQKRTKEQRESESSLNLSEAVLYTHGFKLGQRWPSSAAPAQDCSSTSTGTSCPTPTEVIKNASNVDTATATTWSTMVRDNGGELSAAFQPDYANAIQSGKDINGVTYTCGDNVNGCRYDANGDRKMWVRAQAIVRGRKRTVVATLKLERLPESTPQTAVTAGGINVGNNGSQVKIYAPGSNVVVRCNPKDENGNDNMKCVSNQDGINPDASQGNPPPLMNPSQIERFRQRAIADNTYYEGCPSTWDLAGQVVFIDNCVSPNLSNSKLVTKPCTTALPPLPAGSGGNSLQPDCINQYTAPGLVIWHCGSVDISGRGTFVGIMYFVNSSDNPTTGPCAGVAPRGTTPVDCSGNGNDDNNVMSTTGGFGVWGAIAIDGNGCLLASANGLQVHYDSNVFNAVSSYGAVGLVQDTWRELAPS